jgi:hypothetical protein
VKNRLTDLNDYLFEQLERLADESLSGEQIETEIQRSEAVVDVADKIVTNARLQLDAVKLVAARKRWTARDDDLLLRIYPDTPTADVAGRLGRDPVNVYHRAAKLGLRKSPAYLASPAACRLRRGDNIGAPHQRTLRRSGGRVDAEAARRKGVRQRQGRAPRPYEGGEELAGKYRSSRRSTFHFRGIRTMASRNRSSHAPPPRIFRQGDVLLVAIAAAALSSFGEGKRIKRDNGRVVLAYGEVTGHAHAITEPKVTLRAIDDAAAARQLLASVGLTAEIRDEEVVGLLEVDENAELRHEEHGAIPLAAGERFVVLRQREWSDAEEPIQVAD